MNSTNRSYYIGPTTIWPPMMLVLSFILSITPRSVAAGAPQPGCPKRCGNLEVVYPFGIGAQCAVEGFDLQCDKTADGRGEEAYLGNMPVLNISLLQGQLRVKHHISSLCYNRTTRELDSNEWILNLTTIPFVFSDKDNMFTVIGLNALAYMVSYPHLIGCQSMSSPYNDLTAKDNSCAGAGCCQAAITGNTSLYEVDFIKRYNTTDRPNLKRYCAYAVMMEAAAFKFRTAYLNTTAFFDENGGSAPVILDWAVGNVSCDAARRNPSSYACGNNTRCIDSRNGALGYLCNCSEGYHGNPYLPDGCQDIDECVVNNPRPCPGRCINTPGNFSCPDEKSPGSSPSSTVILVVGPSVGIVMLVIAATCTYLIREKRKLANIKQKYFRQHGGMLLLEKINSEQNTAFSIFTEAELMEATNKFDDNNILGRGGHGTVYKGTLNGGRLIAIKRCLSMTDEQQKKEFGKEMLILSQINHKNIVKLLGCCLDVEVPMLVYEFIPNGTLFHFIHHNNACRNIPFLTRLRIAHESAQALDYLHSWALPPILHGDVKSSNILLDENYAAKVSDFGASILAPTDEAQFVTLVQGTCGYLDPEYMLTCQLTDKSDVYSFGVVLLELLTGKKALNLEGPESERSLSLHFLCALKEGRLMDLIDDDIKSDENAGLLEEVAELAKECLEMTGERRPAMRDVAEKLDRLRKVMQHPWMQHDPEEMESLLGESSTASLEMVSTGNFSMEKRVVQGLLESGR